jgi:hypothetical protein
MSNVVSMREQALDPAVIESIVIKGDLSQRLKPAQKVAYYNYRCQQAGLDPAAKPFDLLKLNGKEVLYANAQCTQQLCAIHKLSTQVTHREKMDDIYLVSVELQGLTVDFLKTKGQWQLHTSKGMPLPMQSLKPRPKRSAGQSSATLDLGCLMKLKSKPSPEPEWNQWFKFQQKPPRHLAKSLQSLPLALL